MKRALPIILLLSLAGGSVMGQFRSNPNRPLAGAWRISLSGGVIGLGCDVTEIDGNYRYRPFGNVDAAVMLHPNIGITVFVGLGNMAADKDELTVGNDFYWTGLNSEFSLPLRQGALAPFVFMRAGLLFSKPFSDLSSARLEGPTTGTFFYGGGIGLEWVYRRSITLRLQGGSLLTLSDKLDNIVSGDRNDGMSFVSFGIGYYLPKRGR